MKKFDPIAVALDTLRFVMRNWRTLIRLTWVPMSLALVAGVVIAAAQGRPYSGSPLDAESAAYLIGGVTAAELALFLLQAPMVAMTAVAVHRLVLFNADRPGEVFPFSFDRTEVLYLVAGLVLGSLMFVIDAVVDVLLHLMFVGAPAWSIVTQGLSASDKVPASLMSVAEWSAYALIVALWVRVLVWPAAVVARRDVSWGEPLSLTKGRFLPLAGLVVFAIALGAALWALMLWLVLLFFRSVIIPHEAYAIIWALSGSIAFWVGTVFLAALASFAYEALRGYRPDEFVPH